MRAAAFIFCITFFFAPCCLAQNSSADSLRSRLIFLRAENQTGNTAHDTDLVNTLNNLAWELMYHDPDTSLILSGQALAALNELKGGAPQWRSIARGKSNESLGVFNYLKGDYAAALSFLFRALDVWEQLEKEAGPGSKILNMKSATTGNIGLIYRNQGDYPKALEYYFRALKAFEELGDKGRIAAALGNIGLVYSDQLDYQRALDYHSKALQMKKQIGNKTEIALTLVNVGIVQWNLGAVAREPKKAAESFDKAFECYSKALQIFEELGNKNYQAVVLGNIGVVYKKRAELQKNEHHQEKADSLYAKALAHYFRAMTMAEAHGNKQVASTNHSNIGSIYLTQKKFTEAGKYLSKSLAISQEINDMEGCRANHQLLSSLDSSLACSRAPLPQRLAYATSALAHYKLSAAYRDSLTNKETIKESERVKNNYEFAIKEAAARAEQEKKDIKTEEEKQKQRLFIWLITAVAGAVSLIAIVIFRTLRLTRRQKRIIEQARDEIAGQKIIVEAQKKEVEEKNKDITDSINYARRIQKAQMPTEKYIKRSFERLRLESN